MLVVDASAMVEMIRGREATFSTLDAIDGKELCAPHLLDFEVLSSIRGLVLGRVMENGEAEEAINYFYQVKIERYPAASLTQRIWELRHQFTSYDASYIALAEALGCPIITHDKKIATSGHNAEVLVF